MSDFGKPIRSQELANLTATAERYIREWLANLFYHFEAREQ
jgi:Rv2258c-like winged HTH domain